MSLGFSLGLAARRCLRRLPTFPTTSSAAIISINANNCTRNFSFNNYLRTRVAEEEQQEETPKCRDRFLESFARYKFLQSENLLTADEELRAYSYFKQAINGPNRAPQPPDSFLDDSEKWHAWMELGNMPSEEAQNRYVNFVNEIQERFANEHRSQASN